MTSLDLFKLDGRIAIVTGGAKNLGRQHALALAEAGATVAICGTDEISGSATEKELQAFDRRNFFRKVDVTKTDEIESFIKEISARLGTIDILVNNAAISSEGIALHMVSDEQWRHIIDVNLSSMFYFGKRVALQMIQSGKGGSIINISSISGTIINNIQPRHNAIYCVAKAGVTHLTHAMASEWASYGIRVNAIAPGFIHTPQTEASVKIPEILTRNLANTPMKRYGQIDELKGAIVFLASEASAYATGSVVTVDGGFTIW